MLIMFLLCNDFYTVDVTRCWGVTHTVRHSVNIKLLPLVISRCDNCWGERMSPIAPIVHPKTAPDVQL